MKTPTLHQTLQAKLGGYVGEHLGTSISYEDRYGNTVEKPLLDAKNVEEWVGRVTAILLKREIIFWEGDDEKELISFGALDEPVIQLEPPSIEEVVDLDEITYDSGSEDMDIEWF